MKNAYFINILFATVIFVSCTKDFVVKNIEKEKIVINSPADNLNTPSNQITFWWDELDGAEDYKIQIVKPNFNSPQQLIVDTVISDNKFIYTFVPGTYQWRIRANNSGGSTDYFTRTLTVDTTSNLVYLSVGLVNPINKTVLGSNSVIFSWNSISSASYYELKITSLLTNSVTTFQNITTTSYPVIFGVSGNNEERFSWQVRAFNSFSQTQNYNSNTFKIDYKSPISATLNPNLYGKTMRDIDSLVWSRNSQDIKYDIVTIGEDSLFMSSVQTTVQGTAPTYIKINTAFTHTGTPAKSLWWKVLSYDSVGNVSAPSISKRFYIQ